MADEDTVPLATMFRTIPVQPSTDDQTKVALETMARLMAPNLMSYLTEPRPPIPNMPDRPQKIPSSDDPRMPGVYLDLANIAAMAAPGIGQVGKLAGGAEKLAGLLWPAAAAEEAGGGGANALARRMVSIYNPPAKELRPFATDYPAGASSDATGRLTADVEGRPLIAQNIVGRQADQGLDVALPPAQYGPITQSAIGAPPQPVAASRLANRAVGQYGIGRDASGGISRTIKLDQDLPAELQSRVTAHEMGHMIDDLAGQIFSTYKNTTIPARMIPQTRDMIAEMRRVYNDLNNPDLANYRSQYGREPSVGSKYSGYGPETRGYPAGDVQRELMAEAVRAYMQDPNYLKSMAPKTAVAIRKAVNENPKLAGTIQFNMVPIAVGSTLVPLSSLGRGDQQ